MAYATLTQFKQLANKATSTVSDDAAITLYLAAATENIDRALSGTMAVSDEGGWVLPMSGNFAMPWIKVPTNKALEADTGACTVDGILTYAIVSV